MNRLAKLRYLATSALIAASLVAGQAFAMQQPIQVTVFVHQDVTEPVERLYDNYLAHWEAAMKNISDREIIFEYITEGNDILTMDYKHDDEDVTTREFIKRFGWHAQANPKGGHGSLRKGLLLTQDPINSRVYGAAAELGDGGIASLYSYNAAAHELGHMFGATHENARGGWNSLCDSYMVSHRNAFKRHCYAYSEANEDAIAQHLIQLP